MKLLELLRPSGPQPTSRPAEPIGIPSEQREPELEFELTADTRPAVFILSDPGSGVDLQLYWSFRRRVQIRACHDPYLLLNKVREHLRQRRPVAAIIMAPSVPRFLLLTLLSHLVQEPRLRRVPVIAQRRDGLATLFRGSLRLGEVAPEGETAAVVVALSAALGEPDEETLEPAGRLALAEG